MIIKSHTDIITGNGAMGLPEWLNRIIKAYQVACSRNALKNLDEDQLSDIGLTRLEADEEADRPFWDAPQFMK